MIRLVLALVLLAGCTVSPQPTPPPAIDVSLLSVAENNGNVTLSGVRGAIVNATSVSLFKAPPPGYAAVSGNVAADGSFSLTFGGLIDNQLRLQGLDEERRSVPIDLVGTPGGELVEPARLGCMTLDAGPEIDFGPGALGVVSTRVVTIRNTCTFMVDITPAEVAVAFVPDFVLTPLGELSIVPGEETPFEIRYQRAFPGQPEAFVVFGWGASSSELRVLTLRGIAQ